MLLTKVQVENLLVKTGPNTYESKNKLHTLNKVRRLKHAFGGLVVYQGLLAAYEALTEQQKSNYHCMNLKSTFISPVYVDRKLILEITHEKNGKKVLYREVKGYQIHEDSRGKFLCYSAQILFQSNEDDEKIDQAGRNLVVAPTPQVNLWSVEPGYNIFKDGFDLDKLYNSKFIEMCKIYRHYEFSTLKDDKVKCVFEPVFPGPAPDTVMRQLYTIVKLLPSDNAEIVEHSVAFDQHVASELLLAYMSDILAISGVSKILGFTHASEELCISIDHCIYFQKPQSVTSIVDPVFVVSQIIKGEYGRYLTKVLIYNKYGELVLVGTQEGYCRLDFEPSKKLAKI